MLFCLLFVAQRVKHMPHNQIVKFTVWFLFVDSNALRS